MSDFTEAQWARAGRNARARSEAARKPIREAAAVSMVRGLADVPFASSKARELALDSELAWPNFEGIEAGSAHGYTADDVRRVVREVRG